MESAGATAYSFWLLTTLVIPTMLYQCLFFFGAIGVAVGFMKRLVKGDN